MTPEMIDSKTMIANGWEPIEYRSPSPIDDDYVFIRWNSGLPGWEVLNHPTIDDATIHPTAFEALQAILNAKPE